MYHSYSSTQIYLHFLLKFQVSLHPSHHSEISILINNLSVSQNNSYSPESVKSWEQTIEVQKCDSSCANIDFPELHTPTHPDTIVNNVSLLT